MANYVSPGVYTIEKDISEYAPSINTSIIGVVGFASKGPTNKATLITSQNNLVRTFGNPSEGITGQALEGSIEMLEQTNSLYFVRASSSDAADASALMSFGSCPGVMVSGPASFNAGEGFGVGSSLTLRVQVYDNSGVSQFPDNSSAGKDFVINTGTATGQGEAIRKILGGGLDSDKVGCFFDGPTDAPVGLGLSGMIFGSFAGSGASIGVSACSGTSFNPTTGDGATDSGVACLTMCYGPSAALNYGASGTLVSSVRVYGTSVIKTGTDSAAYAVESIYPGIGYNGGTTTAGDTSGNSIGIAALGADKFTLTVNDAGTVAESFKTSLVGSGAFIEDVINTGETNLKSEVIKGNIFKDNQDATAASLTDFTGILSGVTGSKNFLMSTQYHNPAAAYTGGTTTFIRTDQSEDGPRLVKLLGTTTPESLAGGTKGTEGTTELVGSNSVTPKTGMQALDDPVLNVGIALVPGIQTEAVQNALITLAETTQNFLALVSPPYAIGTVQDAIEWTNGKSSSSAGSRTSAINSSYAAIHWPWVKVFSTFDSKDRWYDPSIFAARQMAFTDSVADSWFAPAGFRRGRLTKPTEVEVKLNQGDRDSLYSGGNVVNPIVSFPQQGITIFGQRTTQRSPSALDRINVRRLMIYIRKVILAATQRFVFEPNDEFTWAQIEGVLNPFLDDIRRRRGITEFRVVCDESVNTPLRIDRNELWTKVLVKPTKTAEILIFEINLTNQSAQLGSL